VHVLSHSLHYGSAAFEGIRAYKTDSGRAAIMKAPEHARRLLQSMAALGGECPYPVEALVEAMREVVRANAFDECYVRPIAYIGNETRGLKLPAHPEMHIAIAAWKWGKYLGEAAMQRGIRVAVSSFRRPDVASSLPWAKLSGNYLNSILARREATLAGVDEAILLDQQGYVAEGSGENIFLVRGRTLATPPLSAVLHGLTRDAVFEIAAALGLTVKEEALTRNQLYCADEAFFTGTAAEITPIGEIDGRRVGAGAPGPVTKQLADVFDKAVRGADPRFATWLTYV
jgi:branched-chain amino acid aminotransferase